VRFGRKLSLTAYQRAEALRGLAASFYHKQTNERTEFSTTRYLFGATASVVCLIASAAHFGTEGRRA
jgi:hypothetical protein